MKMLFGDCIRVHTQRFLTLVASIILLYSVHRLCSGQIMNTLLCCISVKEHKFSVQIDRFLPHPCCTFSFCYWDSVSVFIGLLLMPVEVPLWLYPRCVLSVVIFKLLHSLRTILS